MPVPTHHHRHSTSTVSSTPGWARPGAARVGLASPPASTNSYSPTVTSGGHHHPNIVTRVAIEGKAKHGEDGVSVKMYLKIAFSAHNLTPGSAVPLFPEENVKILTSQVHPTDNQSVPYNFSSASSPLLHNAARALNLPTRSSKTYHSALGISSSTMSSTQPSTRSSRSNGFPASGHEEIFPIDEQYTGHILVSGYHISYILPKYFPSLQPDDTAQGGSSLKNRRSSIGDKNMVHFMAAIDMLVPFISRPPRSPFLLSIPTPRCLHNHIRLRIFPPTNTSASFASLSSIEDDGSSWDLTSDPHVTRSSARLSHSNSYTHFADDESSDSSTAGFSDGCGIQGTFPSAERIRVRWAKPMKTIDIPGDPGDGRRRVGVKEVKGEMQCVVKGKMKDSGSNGGVVMSVEYKGTCKGVWFPGVATLLGMDVGLEAKGSDVSWIDGSPREWTVSGGVGYTGFDVGVSQTTAESTMDVAAEPETHLPPSSRNENLDVSKHNSNFTTASLLRAPLPSHAIADYSFEATASATSSHLGTVSSLSSLTPGSNPNLNNANPQTRPPGIPITLHLNMNEILPKNIFTFTITGTILVTPRPTLTRSQDYDFQNQSGTHNDDPQPDPIVLPRFTILAADSESTSILVRNEVEGGDTTVEVYNSTGDIYRDAQARKTVLQKNGFTKCKDDGGRIVLRSINSSADHERDIQRPNRPRTPNGGFLPRVPSTSSLRMVPVRPKRDGPLMIPSVSVAVTPLLGRTEMLPTAYAVRLCLNTPTDIDSDWLEFGLAQPGANLPPTSLGIKPLDVKIISASLDGVPVKFETTAAVKPEIDSTGGLNIPFEELSGKEWATWVRVHIGPSGGSIMIVDYVVQDGHSHLPHSQLRGKGSDVSFDIFLPTFPLPVGRLEVLVDASSGINLTSLHSNLRHRQPTQTGDRLLNYSMKEFFYPCLTVVVKKKANYSSWVMKLLTLSMWMLILAGFISLHHLRTEIRQLGNIVMDHSTAITSGWNSPSETLTVTTIVYMTTATPVISHHPETSTEVTLPTPLRAAPSVALVPTDTTRTSQSTTTPTYALIPIKNTISLLWAEHDMELVHVALDKVMKTVDIIWQICRKVYHYPLDPT
ncbi:hypothetical protein BD779DRAFT_1509107 [Infundibulicybe gibba]|nr:hypothetical protein BD779DRAFT_1509107 [Infundibulicybe gibba]